MSDERLAAIAGYPVRKLYGTAHDFVPALVDECYRARDEEARLRSLLMLALRPARDGGYEALAREIEATVVPETDR